MTNSPAHHALREMRRIFSLHTTQIILLAVAVLLGIAGPFGTLENLSFGPRLAYWMVTVPLTFAVGVLVSAYLSERFRDRYSHRVILVMLSCATAIFVCFTIVCLNWLAFGSAPLNSLSTPAFYLPILASAGLVALVFQLLSEHLEANNEPSAQPPAILSRLDLDKRGALVSMSVQDHYVEVTTRAGQSLILMRLSDAMRETGDVEGLQVHRSHWVARAHVVAAKRDGDKAILTLSDGRTLPASRSHIKALKDIGILPL